MSKSQESITRKDNTVPTGQNSLRDSYSSVSYDLRIESETASRNEEKPIKENTHTFGIFSRELPQLSRLRDDKFLKASILDKIRVTARYFTSLLGDFGAAMSRLAMKLYYLLFFLTYP